MIEVRKAVRDDAQNMSVILAEILASWQSDRPSSPEHILANYVEHPDSIRCSVALDATGDILGFQSLQIASDGNPFDLPVG